MNQSFFRALSAPWLLIAWMSVAACADDDSAGTPASASQVMTCTETTACGDGKVCQAGACVAAKGAGLRVDAAARGCEVLLEDTETAKIARAEFGAEARGSYLRRAPRTALSFIAATDVSLGGGAARVLFAGDGQPKLLDSECVGADGKKLSGALVSLSLSSN